MPYLIDGHNLIGKMDGIELSDPDDEQRLVEQLQQFCRRRRRRATVYFDRADPLSRDPAPSAGVTVRFVRSPRTADAAIRDHLDALGGAAKNWTVVSSDREVLRAAARCGAQRVPSSQFARQLRSSESPSAPPEKPPAPSADEVRSWIRIFNERKPPGEGAG